MPERSWSTDEQTEGQNSYSCNYGLQQKINDINYNPVIDDLFYQTDQKDKSDSPIYIVQGSNSVDPIETSVSVVSPPTDASPTIEEAAQTTNTVGYDQVFQHFPEGGDTQSPRNPLDVCQRENLCP